jgi:hypothetical protein
MSQPAFNIPAIYNQLEVLGSYLGFDIEKTNDHVEAIQQLGQTDGVHKFSFEGKQYLVAHVSRKIESDVILSFNSNRWSIKAQ